MKEYESQGVVKADSICEQRLSEEMHDAYYFDIDEKCDKCLCKERYADHCFGMRANYRATEKAHLEDLEGSLRLATKKELRIKKRYKLEQQLKGLDETPSQPRLKPP